MGAPDFAILGQAMLALAAVGAAREARKAWDRDRLPRGYFDVSFEREKAAAWLVAAGAACVTLGFWWGRS